MRVVVGLLAILMVSCTQASQPAATASPGGCRLPIMQPDAQGNAQDAFLSFPAGKVTVDPNGGGGLFYDRPFKRWLPVDWHAVSSDGARYAYLDRKVPGTAQPARLHLVDVSTGNDRIYQLGTDGSAYVVVDFTPEGVWLSYAGYEGSPGGGLFFLDLATGSFKDTGLPGITRPVAGGQGVFWFTDPGPHPQSTPGMGVLIQAEVRRLSVSDGKNEIWFAKPDSAVTVFGTDLAEHPIIGTWLNSADGNGITIWQASSPAAANVIGVLPDAFFALADSHGLWFGSSHGIYLYTQAGGMKKVLDDPAVPAGRCF